MDRIDNELEKAARNG